MCVCAETISIPFHLDDGIMNLVSCLDLFPMNGFTWLIKVQLFFWPLVLLFCHVVEKVNIVSSCLWWGCYWKTKVCKRWRLFFLFSSCLAMFHRISFFLVVWVISFSRSSSSIDMQVVVSSFFLELLAGEKKLIFISIC